MTTATEMQLLQMMCAVFTYWRDPATHLTTKASWKTHLHRELFWSLLLDSNPDSGISINEKFNTFHFTLTQYLLPHENAYILLHTFSTDFQFKYKNILRINKSLNSVNKLMNL